MQDAGGGPPIFLFLYVNKFTNLLNGETIKKTFLFLENMLRCYIISFKLHHLKKAQ